MYWGCRREGRREGREGGRGRRGGRREGSGNERREGRREEEEKVREGDTERGHHFCITVAFYDIHKHYSVCK